MQNMGGLLQKAQQMQKKMLEVEKKLKDTEVVGSASGGLVTIIMDGKGEIKKIKIDPSLKEDLEVIEDLIMAAISDGKKKANQLSEQEMKEVTGGMPMPPGLNF